MGRGEIKYGVLRHHDAAKPQTPLVFSPFPEGKGARGIGLAILQHSLSRGVGGFFGLLICMVRTVRPAIIQHKNAAW
jgi:hypothetical protein